MNHAKTFHALVHREAQSNEFSIGMSMILGFLLISYKGHKSMKICKSLDKSPKAAAGSAICCSYRFRPCTQTSIVLIGS